MTDPQIIALATFGFVVTFSIGWNIAGWWLARKGRQ